jgi:hypothetical protein
MPINMPVEATPPARKLRCARCAAAEQGQQRHRRREYGHSQR